jgi:hypothetical protein
MVLPKIIPSAFHRLAQLPWKILLIVAICSITLHLVFFPETRQTIVRWGQSEDTSFHNVEPATSVPKEHFYPPPPKNPPVVPIVKPAPTSKLALGPAIPPNVKPTPVSSTPIAPNVKPTPDSTPVVIPDPLVVQEPGEYIALCMAIKDQAHDLGEFFVHHYHHVGIQRFYIMDDGSDPPMSAFEYPGVPRSALTFVYHDAANHSKHMEQGLNYRRCMKDYGPRHTWMGFIDGDEFVEMTGKDTLTDMLQELERNNTIGQLVMNWRMHTSGGLLKRPESARKGFTTCISDATTDNRLSDNQHVKPFVRTAFAKEPKGAHMYNLKKGYHTVGEHGDIVDTLAW